jgi:hypothetical protein
MVCTFACTSQTAVVLFAPADAGIDTAADPPIQAPVDAPPDAVGDAQSVTPADAPTDVPADAPTDAAAEAPTDAPAGTQPEGRNEMPADAKSDASPDTQADALPDTPSDKSTDLQANTEAGPQTSELFRDNFGGGYELNWLLSDSDDGPVSNGLDGSNKIATLDATADEFSRLRCNLEGDRFKNTDIIASMKLRIDKAPASTRTVRLDVRQAKDTENIFYAVGATIADDGSITKVGIYKKVDDGLGNYTICALAQEKFATPVAMGQWRTIKLAVSGTTSVHLVAFFEDAPIASYDDDCVSDLTATDDTKVANGGCLADQWGLGVQVEKGTKASVDDVLVTRL